MSGDLENKNGQQSVKGDETVIESKEKISSDSENEKQNKEEVAEKENKEKERKLNLRKPLDQSLLEALFFSSGRPITINRIAIEFGWEPKEVRKLVKDLAKKLDKVKAELQLLEVQRGKWVLNFPLDEYDSRFRGVLETILIEYPKKNIHNQKIKQVLTAVAFHQPVSKPKLFKVLSSEIPEFSIQKLEELIKILVQEGLVRSNIKGTILYKTTGLFANEFGFDPVKIKLKQQLIKRMEKSK